MAELCLNCFIDTWKPNAYDSANIVMSNDYEFCEGCMNCTTYVDHIDQSNKKMFETIGDFLETVSEFWDENKLACIDCGSIFEHDDWAFIVETGECPYCHKRVSGVWMKG